MYLPYQRPNYAQIPYGINYEAAIRLSNTIFSTMVCPKCGERLFFEENNNSSDRLDVKCPNDIDHHNRSINIIAFCELLNSNGLNSLVKPVKFQDPEKKSEEELKETDDSVSPPPEGLKVRPI